MTNSGGKPHAVGDNGQRYEVSFYEPTSNERKVMGWSDSIEAALNMMNAIEQHPSWAFPQMKDRTPPLILRSE